MKHKIIATAWQDYAQKIIPPGAPLIQIAETCKAFYAGAGAVLDGILKVLGPGAEPTESDLLIMDGIQEELADFIKSVKESA